MSKWIKCSEQPPPSGVQVLAYGPDCGEMVDGVDICVRYGPDDDWWEEGGTEMSLTHWTHWMPVPDPPPKEK